MSCEIPSAFPPNTRRFDQTSDHSICSKAKKTAIKAAKIAAVVLVSYAVLQATVAVGFGIASLTGASGMTSVVLGQGMTFALGCLSIPTLLESTKKHKMFEVTDQNLKDTAEFTLFSFLRPVHLAFVFLKDASNSLLQKIERW